MPGFARTLESTAIKEIEDDAVGEFLFVFIGETRRSELAQVIPLGCDTAGRIADTGPENQRSVTLDADVSSFPEKGAGELDIELANFNCLGIARRRGWLLGGLVFGGDVLFFHRGAFPGTCRHGRHAAQEAGRSRLLLVVLGG